MWVLANEYDHLEKTKSVNVLAYGSKSVPWVNTVRQREGYVFHTVVLQSTGLVNSSVPVG